MPNIDVRNIRNVALLSHSGAGKTSLCESLLFNIKAVTRIGRVEDGNTFSDYEPKRSSGTAAFRLRWCPAPETASRSTSGYTRLR